MRELLNALAEKLMDLYVLNVNKHLRQRKPSPTSPKTYREYQRPINLSDMKDHIKGKTTIGVFGGNVVTKFITFDIDVSDDKLTSEDNHLRAKQITYHLIHTLIEDFNIQPAHIFPSFSGKKGYHVDIFFSESIDKTFTKRLYDLVLERMGADPKQIELRPTSLGVKVPLGIHKETGQKAFYCDHTLEKLPDESILEAQPLDVTSWIDWFNDTYPEENKAEIFKVTHTEAVDIENVIMDIYTDQKTVSEQKKDIIDVVNLGQLKYKGTRDIMTLRLAIFYKTLGYDQEEAFMSIANIIGNTFEKSRELISEKTTLDYAVKEVSRIVKLTYAKDYEFKEYKTTAEVTRSEMLQILQIKKLPLQKLLFSFLLHSKLHAQDDGTFYMTYKTLERMGNDSNRLRLADKIRKLQSMGLIEIVSHNEIDRVRSLQENRPICKPNVYKVLLEKSTKKEPCLLVGAKGSISNLFYTVVAELIDPEVCKGIVGRSTYYKRDYHKAYTDKEQ
jgi:hypothetical protein